MNTCTKTSYPSKKTAHAAARRLRASSSEPFCEYFCDLCGLWHLTTTPRKKPVPGAPRVARNPYREPVRTLEELEARARAMRAGGSDGET